MSVLLPPALEDGAARLIEGVSRKALAQRFSRIAQQYQRGGASHSVVETEADVAAYVFSRLPGTFAAVSAVFEDVANVAESFSPRSVLDVGAGPGGASWAATQRWPGLERLTMIDANPVFLSVARQLAAASDHPVLSNPTQILADFTLAEPPRADLVVLSYGLAEVAEAQAGAIAERLWAACEGVLILVEPGSPAGFARIGRARAALVGQGANVLAPCTHGGDCPMRTPNWCHFSRRLPRSRDHMRVKGAVVPFEDEKFSYLAVSRFPCERTAPAARILTPPRLSKIEAAFSACSAEGLVERRIPRRDRHAYARARKLRWGDLDEAGDSERDGV